MPRFYVTTPIYYVNDVPHIGHAYTMVAADALARWHRLLGDDVFFLTGTDEHGDKIARAAEAHGVSPQEWVGATSQRFREAWAALDISNDDFIRTTEGRHHTAVQRFLQAIHDNGYTELGVYRGLYCVSCEDYKKESELVDGNCPIHFRPVEELLEEENYFFKLSAFENRLLEWYEDNPDAVRPPGKRNEALGVIKGGLEDISITRRSTTWGVPVPWDEDHVFYVWYDALVNYLTAIGYGQDDERFGAWWPAVHHLIGKEIIRFHCVWWPAMCMAAGIDPPAHLLVHGWLLVSGEKMSKSRANQIAPRDLTDDFGVDAVRYYLLRDTPFGTDGDFSYEGMTARYNSDLANNLGNLLARVSTVVGSKCGGVGPAPDPDSRLRRRGGYRRGRRCRRAGIAAAPRPRGDVATDPRDQRRARGDRAVEGRARSRRGQGPRERARGAAHRRPAGLAGHARHERRDLASARARWSPGRLPGARGRRVGPVPRRTDSRQGDPAVPATERVTGGHRGRTDRGEAAACCRMDRLALPPPGHLSGRGSGARAGSVRGRGRRGRWRGLCRHRRRHLPAGCRAGPRRAGAGFLERRRR